MYQQPEKKGPIRGRGRKRSQGSYHIDGKIIPDVELIDILREIYHHQEPKETDFYLKTLGTKKLSIYLFKHHGILVNHKKLDRIRKAHGWVRTYYLKKKHPRRSQACYITRSNEMWQMDIKYYRTWKDGLISVLTIMDVMDRIVVGLYRARRCNALAVRMTLKAAMENRKVEPDQLTIRNDRGCQFTAKEVTQFLEEVQVIQEFGMPAYPNSQAFVESHHASSTQEFEYWNDFENLKDFIEKHDAYLRFYHELRPHKGLNYKTPAEFKTIMDGDNPPPITLNVFR